MASRMNSLQLRRTRLNRMPHRMLVLAIGMSVLTSVATAKYGGGSGTVADPYQIHTAEHLVELGDNRADWGKQFKLMEDIDLAGYDETNFQVLGYWEGLGDVDNRPFNGIFDGNGKTISNFSYRDVSGSYVGLFRYVAVGEIRNLGLINATVIGDGGGTGSLVGYLQGGAVIDCYATGINVSGNLRVGGLIGDVDGGVARCASQGTVAGVRYVGGLIGQVDEGNVARSYSKATVFGNEGVGGFVGATVDDTTVINACYATGRVDGGVYVGGLAGQAVAGRLYHCYSTGVVTAGQHAGGLVGNTMFRGEVIGSFWDTEASRQTTSVGGTGKTTAEMKSANTFSSWDFYLTWAICEGTNYPVFWWQIPIPDLRCPDGVNAVDFATFARKWKHRNCIKANEYCDGTDFDESGSVGFPDLAILAENWLRGID